MAGTMNFVCYAYMDDSPPLIIRQAHLLNPVVEQGGQVRYLATYDKRVDCSPPQGEGHVHYKYEALNPTVAPPTPSPNGKVIRDKVAGTISDPWPAGKNLKGEGYVAVPDDLPEGTYELSAVAVYTCSRSPTTLKAKTPTMTLQVVARKAAETPVANRSESVHPKTRGPKMATTSSQPKQPH